jgi:hypothetical protein
LEKLKALLKWNSTVLLSEESRGSLSHGTLEIVREKNKTVEDD